MNHPSLPEPAIQALAEGDIRKLNEILGREYSVRGKVVHGNHVGRTLGFPTANLDLFPGQSSMPAHGVYMVYVEVLNRRWRGIANIGVRPTVDGRKMTFEVNILDFDRDIYDHVITVSFVDFLRKEQKFSGLEALREQIQHDKEKAEFLFSQLP
jgi:riboflavin kinase/FMN adenylyltransferase